jgi:cell wall-associated NlpC family hydrolase
MTHLICAVPVCPVRAEPSHRSEQVTQLLFGEMGELIEKSADFVKIRVLFDGYEGWCQATQLEETEPDNENLHENRLAGNWVNEILLGDLPMHIPFASTIPSNGVVGKSKLTYHGSIIDSSTNSGISHLRRLTSVFINTPYLWGGRSVFGIDCSGFTQIVFKCMGIPLLRDASQQVKQGDEVGFLPEVKPGDLAFFDNPAGKITHVGILLDPETVIHAAGKVRVDTIDTSGIINRNTGRRTHTLRVIKRITDVRFTSF